MNVGGATAGAVAAGAIAAGAVAAGAVAGASAPYAAECFLTVCLRGKRVVIVRLFGFPRRLRRRERGFESGAGRVRVVRGDDGGVVRGVHRRRVVRRRRLRGRGGARAGADRDADWGAD